MSQRQPVERQKEEEGQIHGFHVVYERTETGWSAYSPDLPGLGGAGASRHEIERLMSEAIPMHLEAMRRDRLERPQLYGDDAQR